MTRCVYCLEALTGPNYDALHAHSHEVRLTKPDIIFGSISLRTSAVSATLYPLYVDGSFDRCPAYLQDQSTETYATPE